MKKTLSPPKKNAASLAKPEKASAKFETICLETPEIPSLALETAIGRIERWKTTEQIDVKPLNGFFIRYDDILGLIRVLHNHARDKKIMGVRAYIGLHELVSIDPGKKYQSMSMMFVGVEAATGYPYGKDIIDPGSDSDAGDDGSGIFDLTQPCPTCCDGSSPLYSSFKKRKLPLNKLGVTKTKTSKKKAK